MNTTLSFLLAAMQRAENEGARSLDVNIKDLRELLPFVEAGMHRAKLEKPMKHLGWMKPGSVAALCNGNKRATRVSRRRDDEFNMEVFFCDSIREKQKEADAAKIVAEAIEQAKKYEVQP